MPEKTQNLNQKYINAKKAAANYLKGRVKPLQKPQTPQTSQKPHTTQTTQNKPQIPPGQRVVSKMIAMPPITVDYTYVQLEKWQLRLYGEVENEKIFNWQDFNKLPQQDYLVDFHCVTSWSKLGQKFIGVDLHDLIALVKPLPTVKHIIFECYDGYTTNVVYDEVMANTAFIALKMDGADIPPQYGGPSRVVIPHLYGWKSAKHVTGIRFQSLDSPGFWEVRGYNNHADPWEEERYS